VDVAIQAVYTLANLANGHTQRQALILALILAHGQLLLPVRGDVPELRATGTENSITLLQSSLYLPGQCQDTAPMDGRSPYMHYEKLLSLRVPYFTNVMIQSVHITTNFWNDNYYY